MTTSALFRPSRTPPPLEGMGAAAWAGHLAVDTLEATRIRLRSNGRIAD